MLYLYIIFKSLWELLVNDKIQPLLTIIVKKKKIWSDFYSAPFFKFKGFRGVWKLMCVHCDALLCATKARIRIYVGEIHATHSYWRLSSSLPLSRSLRVHAYRDEKSILYSQQQKSRPNFTRAFRVLADTPSARTEKGDALLKTANQSLDRILPKGGADGQFMQIYRSVGERCSSIWLLQRRLWVSISRWEATRQGKNYSTLSGRVHSHDVFPVGTLFT